MPAATNPLNLPSATLIAATSITVARCSSVVNMVDRGKGKSIGSMKFDVGIWTKLIFEAMSSDRRVGGMGRFSQVFAGYGF